MIVCFNAKISLMKKKRSEKKGELVIKVGKRIAQLRQDADLTQEILAEEAGITSTTLSRIECGTTETSITILGQISKALNVSLPTIFAEAEVTPIGLPWELDELVRKLRNQKPLLISAASEVVDVLISLSNKKK